MDMEFSEEQQQLMKTARAFLEKECPLGLVREVETSELGFSPELWRRMADLGWLGMPFPPEHGGLGLSNVDLAVLANQLGRALCPGPFIPTVVLAGGAIAAAGTEEQKQSYLPRIAAGEAVVAFALQEPDGRYDPRAVSTRATGSADGYVLDGAKMFVEFANAADRLLVVARTGGEPPSIDGLTMFLVDARSPGLSLTPLHTMARDRQFRVELNRVAVPAKGVLGPVGGAGLLLQEVVNRGAVTLCAYMVGAAARVHEMATEFAKQRVQFDRPIGSFQAIQHYLAQTVTEISAADTATLYAAWTLDRGLPAREVVAKAKAFAGDTFKRASAIGAQIYGGLGFNEDVDTTLFLRRGKQLQLSMGDTGNWEDVIAEEILDR